MVITWNNACYSCLVPRALQPRASCLLPRALSLPPETFCQMKTLISSLLIAISVSLNAQDWKPHFDSLQTILTVLSETNPYDEVTDAYDPIDLIEMINQDIPRHLSRLAEMGMPVEKLQELSELNINADSTNQLYIFQWDAKNGGTFQQWMVHAWVRNGSGFNYCELPFAGYTIVLETYVSDGRPIFLTSTFVKGCGSCFTGQLTLLSFKDSTYITEARLDIYSRSWEMEFTRQSDYLYHFESLLWDEAYVHLYNQNELTYSSEEDDQYELHFPLTGEDDYTRRGNGTITIVDGKRMVIGF